MAHAARDLIAANSPRHQQEAKLISTLGLFLNGIVELMEDLYGDENWFGASVVAFLPNHELATVAYNKKALGMPMQRRGKALISKAEMPAFVEGLLSKGNIYIRRNQIAVGIRKMSDRADDLPELIGAIVVNSIPRDAKHVIFRNKHDLTEDLHNMLLAYADLMFGIMTLHKTVKSKAQFFEKQFKFVYPVKINANLALKARESGASALSGN
jgi:hypothetical protein